MFKKILVAQFLTTITFAASQQFAGSASKWELGAGALYLKPSVSYRDLNFDRISPPTHYDWGGMLSGAYFYTPENDINVNWLYYSESNRDSFSQPTYFAGFVISGRADTQARYKNTFNVVNLEFGKSIFLKSMHIRAHAGGQYLNHDFAYNDIVKETPLGSTFHSIFDHDINSRYQGGGPRIGLDVSHDLNGKKWAVFANGASAVLLGQTKSSLYSRGISSHFISFYDSIRKSRTVSELGLQLGLSYKTKVHGNQLKFSGGWLVTRFFNLIQTGPSSTHTTPATLSGPFLNAKISEDV